MFMSINGTNTKTRKNKNKRKIFQVKKQNTTGERKIKKESKRINVRILNKKFVLTILVIDFIFAIRHNL